MVIGISGLSECRWRVHEGLQNFRFGLVGSVGSSHWVLEYLEASGRKSLLPKTKTVFHKVLNPKGLTATVHRT